MTIEELNQLQSLKTFIAHERERLENMRESLGLKSPVITDMPKKPGASDKIGDTMPKIVDEEVLIEDTIRQCTEMQNRLVLYIHQVPDVKIKMFMTLRFIDGMSWNDVADYVDPGTGKYTADAVRMAVVNYLKREEDCSA